jgi:hypothetical protein
MISAYFICKLLIFLSQTIFFEKKYENVEHFTMCGKRPAFCKYDAKCHSTIGRENRHVRRRLVEKPHDVSIRYIEN